MTRSAYSSARSEVKSTSNIFLIDARQPMCRVNIYGFTPPMTEHPLFLTHNINWCKSVQFGLFKLSANIYVVIAGR